MITVLGSLYVSIQGEGKGLRNLPVDNYHSPIIQSLRLAGKILFDQWILQTFPLPFWWHTA